MQSDVSFDLLLQIANNFDVEVSLQLHQLHGVGSWDEGWIDSCLSRGCFPRGFTSKMFGARLKEQNGEVAGGCLGVYSTQGGVLVYKWVSYGRQTSLKLVYNN